jgi:methionyl aminopeptidase
VGTNIEAGRVAVGGTKARRVSERYGIILKSPREIELMRAAGRVVNRVLARMRELAVPGVSTAALNREAEAMIAESGGTALFKGVENPQAKYPFPAALCTSVNHVLVHGVPDERPLAAGDIVSIDCGVRLAGYCGDSAVTLSIGEPSASTRRLMEVTEGALSFVVAEIRPGRMWSELAAALQAFVEDAGFSVVRDFVGHGIGREMHEEPKVPNYWSQKQKLSDFELVPGLVLAVEPMVNAGSRHVDYADGDGWAVVTRDGKYCAHYEHTIAVTESGADVLTDGR